MDYYEDIENQQEEEQENNVLGQVQRKKKKQKDIKLPWYIDEPKLENVCDGYNKGRIKEFENQYI